MKTLQVRDIFPINDGGTVTVVEINNTNNIVVKHNDQFEHVSVVSLHNLNNGQVKNPYHPGIFNVGYMGVGPYLSRIKKTMTVEYVAWINMLRRCYDLKTRNVNITYANCTVVPEWLNFQNFALWYCSQPDYGKGYHLDKDILYKGNQIYGPHTCVLVPPDVNGLFVDVSHWSVNRVETTGIYRRHNRYLVKSAEVHLGSYATLCEAQEAYISYRQQRILTTAEDYKGVIDPRVYYAMIALAHSM